MVALLAIIQITLGIRQAQAQDRLGQNRRTVEEALDLAGEDIGKELEELFEQLEITGDKIGQKIERWAEENSEELEAWSEKYGDQWERFGDRFARGIWTQWAERYERDIERWADRLDSEELNAESIGGFVESNLDMLSKMPLGQLVDQALEDGVGELKGAPWESLDELGRLAKSALEQPIEELGSLTIEGARTKRALEDATQEMGRSLGRLKEDIGRNISDDARDDSASRSEARIRALKALLKRDGITEEQRERVEEMIDGIRATQLDGIERRMRAAESRQRDVDVPKRDQILERIKREKKRHAEALDQFNQDLRRSSEESREMERQKSNEIWRIDDARSTKRPDGRNLDSNSRKPANAREPQSFFRDGDGRQPRKQNSNSRRAQSHDSKRGSSDKDHADAESKKSDSEMEALRRQVEELRKEVQRLRNDRRDW